MNNEFENQNIAIACPDGFINQLRLSLAANFLVSIGHAKTAQQLWIINNHNNVCFHKFFFDLPYLQFIDSDVDFINSNNIIHTKSFTHMVSGLDVKKTLRQSFTFLKTQYVFSNMITKFIKQYHISNCIGVHIRTGCKTALLNISNNRGKPTNDNIIIHQLWKNYPNHNIYLATDNAETQNKWIEIFGDRLIYFQKIDTGTSIFNGPYDRSKVERFTSDVHTVADFLILQKCHIFYGSNESSLSIMVNLLRNQKADGVLMGTL